MRCLYWLLPLLVALLVGCDNSPQTKATTAPSNPESQSPPIPDFSSSPTSKAK